MNVDSKSPVKHAVVLQPFTVRVLSKSALMMLICTTAMVVPEVSIAAPFLYLALEHFMISSTLSELLPVAMKHPEQILPVAWQSLLFISTSTGVVLVGAKV